MDSTELWKQSLVTVKNQLQTLAAEHVGPGCVYGVFSPEPIRQQHGVFAPEAASPQDGESSSEPIRRRRTIPEAEDFKEVYKLDLTQQRRRSTITYGPVTLKQTAQSVEALYPISFGDETALDKYEKIATDMAKIVFGEASDAKRLLGLPADLVIAEQDIWTIALFRLATLAIEGSGLYPKNAFEKNDVFKTLWPTALDTRNASAGILKEKLACKQSLLLPKIYEGDVWILEEATGSFQMSDSETPNEECTLRFSPPLVLYGSSHADRPPVELPPLFYYSWTGEHSPFSTVTVLQPDGSPLDGFESKRILGVRPLFSEKAGWADDYGNNRYRSENHPHSIAILRGKSNVHVINCFLYDDDGGEPNVENDIVDDDDGGELNFENGADDIAEDGDGEETNGGDDDPSVETHEIPIRISFLDCVEGAQLVIWPYEEPVEGNYEEEEQSIASPSIPDSSVQFIQSNLPLVQFYLPDSVWTVPIRLEDAENLLGFYARNDEDTDPPELPNCPGPLPQQRITNVVQELDSLFDASIMAIDLALVKGKEWFRQVIEQTAPIFNGVWEDGVFTVKKNNELVAALSKLQKFCKDSSRKSSEDKSTPLDTGKPKKKRHRFTQGEWKKILSLALLFLRIDPTISSNKKLAELVSRVFSGVAGSDFSKVDGKNPDDLEHFKKTAKSIRSSAKHENLSDSANDSADEKTSTEGKQKNLKSREPDPALEVELDEELKLFCRSEELPLMTREELIDVCIAQPELAKQLDDFLKSRKK